MSSTRMIEGKNGATPPEFSSAASSAKKQEKSSILNRPERTLEQLWHEHDALSVELEARTKENVLLNEVISTVGSTLKLDEVLNHVVDTITRATSCHAAFLYLYDQEKEQLTLASTSELYRYHIGKITMPLGEGIAGWVGMNQQPVVIREGSINDPRFRPYPELEEEKFQSLMSVPVVSKDRLLIGAS